MLEQELNTVCFAMENKLVICNETNPRGRREFTNFLYVLAVSCSTPRDFASGKATSG